MQTETRSQAERHWDNIAMAITAVSTAAAVAVFLILDQRGGGEAHGRPALANG